MKRELHCVVCGTKPELKTFRVLNVSLNAAVNKYRVWANSLKKKGDEEKVSGLAFLRECRRSKRELPRRKSKNKLLGQPTEGLSDSAVREAGTSSRIGEKLLEGPLPQHRKASSLLRQ